MKTDKLNEIVSKLKSVQLCLMAHPDNEPYSEFEDRIDDLEEIIKVIAESTPETNRLKDRCQFCAKFCDEGECLLDVELECRNQYDGRNDLPSFWEPHPDIADTMQPETTELNVSMEAIFKAAMKLNVNHQVQFVDYSSDTWTVPCKLSDYRLEKLLTDNSISKVRVEFDMKTSVRPAGGE